MDWQQIIQQILARLGGGQSDTQLYNQGVAGIQGLPGASVAYPRSGYMAPANADMTPGVVGTTPMPNMTGPLPYSGQMPSPSSYTPQGYAGPTPAGMSYMQPPRGTWGSPVDSTIQGMIGRYLGR